MSTQNSPPGLLQPTVNSYPPGANSPFSAGKAINDANNERLNNIIKMSGAGSRRRHKKGGASEVTVPVIKPIYTPQNGPSSDPTAQQAQGQSINMQSVAWSADDSKAVSMGGRRRRYKKGGNSDWMWGCYSGGKRRTKNRRNTRRTRKNKRKTKRRAHH